MPLVDAGADLAEFASGLAEVLRALVMHHYGIAAEAIPESTQAVITTAATGIGPEDAVRMLKLLGEAEPAIRRSANPRIVLETLLLRWAMMDRAVDLRAILEGLPTPAVPPARASVVPARRRYQRSRRPRRGRPARHRKRLLPQTRRRNRCRCPARSVECTTEAITAAWSGILAAAARPEPPRQSGA